MSLPVASALTRRDRFWPAVSASLVVHVALVAWALARTPPIPDLHQTPLRARLVRLGEKKPESFLPRKEEPPPAPAPSPVTAPPEPGAATAPAPAAARAGKATSKQPSPAAGGGLASVLSRVQKEVEEERRWGDPDGDAAGDSDVSEGDRYIALVDRALRANYEVPSTISEQERLFLKASLSLRIEADGTISSWRFEERSGNPAFDAALERTLRATRLPPPPDARRDFYRRTGLQVTFKI